MTCSMIAWPRCVLSAVTVSRALVVKKAWKRHSWNRLSWPGLAGRLRSGMRRTTRRPGTCSARFRELKAVKPTSATSAREIHLPDSSS